MTKICELEVTSECWLPSDTVSSNSREGAALGKERCKTAC